MDIIFWSLGAILNFLNPQVPAAQEWYFSRSGYAEYQKTFRHYYDYGEYLPQENLFYSDDSVEDAGLLESEAGLELTDLLENPAYGPQSEGAIEGGEVNIPEAFYRKNDNTLSYFQYGEEKLSVLKLPQGTALVSVNSNEIIQRLYGDDNLLREKTFWKSKSQLGADPVRTIIFEYSDSEEKNLYRTYESDKESQTYTENIYNQNGKCTSIKKWVMNEEKGRLIQSEQFLIYDEENRIKEKKYNEYITSGNKSKVKFKQRYLYDYKDFAESPDEDFYENNVLRVSKKNIDDKKKIITYYFDDDFKMQVLYEHGIKVKETVFYNNQEVQR
ncbi:hypothetical protein [Treponema sp.]|uniref:hypothetical protein n=1 Tax=Treponema sp. TaxID=166 RepID=UPI0025CBA91A|nr:hypothetical protein [Treponema sp.]MCR5219127.1 hypothetical protein [Treponema sp.]